MILELEYGKVEIKLFQDVAPNHVKRIINLSEKKEFLGCLRRNGYVTVLLKQRSDKIPGDFLGRLVLGIEGDQIKVFGATIF